MKPLHLRLQEERALKNCSADIIEKDYALSYVLAGISRQDDLNRSLVFKGGTALKKIFFGNYRFSVDLDFSTLNAPKKQALENALKMAVNESIELLSEYGHFEMQVKRYPERNPHPTGQEAFNVHVKFPWHRTPMCTVKVEVTHDEPVVLSPIQKSIIHDYKEETLDCSIMTYHIEEIIAEKLRALLQTHKNLVMRGWNRPRARDYYDLWNILKNYRFSIDANRLISVLEKKCQHRDVSYKTTDDFFTEELMSEAQLHWQTTLGNLVVGLPSCDHVLNETKKLINDILILIP